MVTIPIVLISIGLAAIIALIGIVWRNLSIRVDGKVDQRVYNETMIHLQKAVDGINGTAQVLKDLACDISVIHNDFLTRKDFQYEMKIHYAVEHRKDLDK